MLISNVNRKMLLINAIRIACCLSLEVMKDVLLSNLCSRTIARFDMLNLTVYVRYHALRGSETGSYCAAP